MQAASASTVLSVVALTLATASGCAPRAERAAEVRFVNAPPVWQVDDRRHTPNKPSHRPYYRALYALDALIFQPVDRFFAPPAPRRAMNVNSMDEVPSSTWFTNRIGVRDMSLEELRRGPNEAETPERHLPFTVVSAKTEGVAPGFVVEDARGYKFVLKFDVRGFPESESGAGIIVQRLMHALGYNVSHDYLVFFDPADLRLGKDAIVDLPLGERPMTKADFEAELRRIERRPDGRIRALASRYVPGEPLGGHPQEGTRPDDPNDLVPHQHRRELRGLYPIMAWVNNPDIKEYQSVDTWVEDPARPGHRYLVHYWIDFGKSFGLTNPISARPTAGFTYELSLSWTLMPMFTLGLLKRPWDGKRPPPIPGVGFFDVDSFDPAEFRSNMPYRPFVEMDRFDGFWGAKLIMRFTRAQLAAIVDEAKYSDPRTSAYVLETLIGRQRLTGRYWFRQVAPLDQFSLMQGTRSVQLCFADLALLYRLEAGDDTTYRVTFFDGQGGQLGRRRALAGPASGRACVPEVRPASVPESYTIVHIVTRRGDTELPPVEIHLAAQPGGQGLRIIGIHRR